MSAGRPHRGGASIEVDDARDRLTALAVRARRGECVLLTVDGEPYALLGPPHGDVQDAAVRSGDKPGRDMADPTKRRSPGGLAQWRRYAVTGAITLMLVVVQALLAVFAPREIFVLGVLGTAGVGVYLLFIHRWPVEQMRCGSQAGGRQ